MALHGSTPRGGDIGGSVSAADLVQAVRRVAAAIAAAPMIAEKVRLDSRMTAYEAADLVREVQDRLFNE